MSKTTFNLEAVQFSDSDHQTPISEVLNSYNRQYSLIYQEIASFLKQCKDNIFKYIQLNQFGVGFNICGLFAQVTKIQTSVLSGISDVAKQQLEHQKSLKNKYEKQFQLIMQRMSCLIQDFLKFQVQFKRQYFGFNMKQPQLPESKKLILSKSPLLSTKLSTTQKSVTSSESMAARRKLLQPPSEQESKKQTELQQKLREILKRKLAPQKENIIKFCDLETDPLRNMLKLQQKIDMMQSEIILSKGREEKIIQIFNKRRLQNMVPKGEEVHCELIETDDGRGKESRFNPKGDRSRDNVGKSLRKVQHVGFAKPSLTIETSNLNNLKEQLSPSKVPHNNSQTPRKLISPRGFKSPREAGSTNAFNFFSSPRHGLNQKLPSKSPSNFKKKVQQEEDFQSNINYHTHHNIMSKKEQQENSIKNNNTSANKNKHTLLRMKSSNQVMRLGAATLIDQSY